MNSMREIRLDKNNNAQHNEIKAFLENEGAVILREVITDEEVSELKTALVKALKEDEEKYGESYIFKGMVHALMIRGAEFLKLLENQQLISIYKAILGHGCIVHAYNSSSMPPNLSNFSRSIHVDCPRLIPGYITNVGITIALDAFTSNNGAMEITPHLFQQASPPSEEMFEKEKIVLDNLEPGDAILFNARCWHRGGKNTTKEWRHAVSMNLCRAYMRQQFDYPAMIGEKIKSYSEDLKQLLGYNVRMPNSMEQFLLPPNERLYKSGQE